MKQKDAFFYRGVCLSRRLKKGEEEEKEKEEKEEEEEKEEKEALKTSSR